MVQPTPGSKVTQLQLQATYNNYGKPGQGGSWFGPMAPMAPMAPPEVAGRQFDFIPGVNLALTPRQYEPITFAQLRALADAYDVLRTIIETRKDQMKALKWAIRPKLDANGKQMAQPGDERIGMLSTFFESPDREHDWDVWLGMLLEDMFVLDAATLFKRRTRGGLLYGLEPVDGAVIKRVVDDWGRTPAPPYPAYQQILKGMPAVNLTTDDMLYAVRNYRTNSFYGFSQVQQIIMTIQIAMRREMFQLDYYTEGSMPEGIVSVPPEWTPDMTSRFEHMFNGMLAGNMAMRRRLKFVPSGVGKNFIPMKEPNLTGEMDVWLTRICCFAFSISPQPFVDMMNRATAETAENVALQEGLIPTMRWAAALCNRVIRDDFGITDIEFGWVDDREPDAEVQAKVLDTYVKAGILKLNEARDKIGEEPVEGGDIARVYTANGYVPIGINDDMPTAGESAATASAIAERMGSGGDDDNSDDDGAGDSDPSGPDGNRPNSEGPTPSDVEGADYEAEKLRKARRTGLTHSVPHVARNTLAMKRMLAKHFKMFAEQAAAKAVENYPEVEKASPPDPSDADGIHWDAIIPATIEYLETTAIEAVSQAFAELNIEFTEPVFDQAYSQAVEAARNRAAEMVGRKWVGDTLVDNPDARWAISETTRRNIQSEVTRAINEGLPAKTLADNIKGMTDFSPERAEMVARTEIINANNMGHMDAFRAGGVTEKEWSTAGEGVCPICIANEEQGAIPLEQAFQGGDLHPPQHPDCRCTLVPVVDLGDDE